VTLARRADALLTPLAYGPPSASARWAMTARRYRDLSPRPPRLRSTKEAAASRPARSWQHVLLISVAAAALFLVLLLVVGFLGNVSMHEGVFPSTTQGKFYRPD